MCYHSQAFRQKGSRSPPESEENFKPDFVRKEFYISELSTIIMSSHHHHENAGGRGHGHTHKNCGHHQDLTLFIPKLIETLSWEKKNENVLDYGCGNGQNSYRYLLPEILKHDSKLYSVDINEKLVELAKKDCAHPNVTYAVGNILEDFPFGDVRFDKIFSIYVFHFVPDLSKALARLGSLLKPGGQLAFTLHKTSYFNVIQALAEMDKWKEYTKGCDRFSSAFAFSDSSSTEATFEALMKKAGFKVLFTDSKTLERNYDDIDRYLGTQALVQFTLINLFNPQLHKSLANLADLYYFRWDDKQVPFH